MPKINSNHSDSKAIEQRLAAIEARISELAQLIQEKLEPKRARRKAVGAFTGDDGVREFFDDALKQRDADRIKARIDLNEPLATALPG
ncbi:MAG: hypothetical protein ACKV2Q_32705 [Planctomycetaceae bacterium]